MVMPVLVPVLEAMERAVVGRRTEIEALLAAYLADGHVLLEGTPGTAKTLMVRALAAATGGAYRRIQFTPDLMPADVTGLNVYDAPQAAFRFVRGPVFGDVVLADEINRAPAKTQAALLECMEERHVTVDGTSYPLPPTFTVFATMNPLEFEGTFPLPEAQLDRFMMKITMTDLALDKEQEVVARFVGGFDPWSLGSAHITPVLPPAVVVQLRAAVRKTVVEAGVQHYLVNIVRATRSHAAVLYGASTRAAVALLRASQARATYQGRDYVIPDDIKALAPWVLAHRLSLRPEAQLENVDGLRVIRDILNTLAVPRAA